MSCSQDEHEQFQVARFGAGSPRVFQRNRPEADIASILLATRPYLGNQPGRIIHAKNDLLDHTAACQARHASGRRKRDYDVGFAHADQSNSPFGPAHRTDGWFGGRDRSSIDKEIACYSVPHVQATFRHAERTMERGPVFRQHE